MKDTVKPADQPASRRRDVLRVLKAARAPMSVVAIADQLGVHPNTVRFHLESLVSAGRVEQAAPLRKGPGRPAQMFQATRQMDRSGPRHYRLLAEILAMGLEKGLETGLEKGLETGLETGPAAQEDPLARALEVGRAWGRRVEPPPRAGEQNGTAESVEQLLELLDELGFAPERLGDAQIGLRHCPFLELAETRPGVVCSIHLGIMQGALQRWTAPVAVERLEEFAEPDLCLVHLGRAR
ncbi:helix-turn-helix domain-containing protein [Mycobacterium sp.]|uniref:helix-turn-helix transcriptional regulator n=1 Tax=Mycobacterium sp. TaxID=1785 RepID=UPI00128A9A4C|nr:helix-turn-helix domain-containing protein [Mycobacterium sp.]KAA8957058.1 MAG: helix-turn-helix domain-containing protein [Mycobacterium sp.]